MTRLMILLTGTLIILATVMGFYGSQTELSSFMLINTSMFWLRLGLGASLLLYGLFDSVRFKIFRSVLAITGLALMGVSVLGFFRLNFLIIDEVIFLGGGIFALVGGLELSRSTPVSRFDGRFDLTAEKIGVLRFTSSSTSRQNKSLI